MKKLVISNNNKSQKNIENLYLNFQSYFDYSETSESFNRSENIVPHYVNAENHINLHLEKCEKIYNNIMPDLMMELNNFYKKDYSIKSGHLLFGFWLDRLIRICYDRFNLLKNAFHNFEIDEIQILDTKDYDFYSTISQDITKLSSEKNWNYAMISMMLEYFQLHKISYEKNIENYEYTNYFPINTKNFFLTDLYKKICKVLKFISRNQKMVFSKTYIPLFLEKKIEIKLKQIPFIWDFSFSVNKKFDRNKRSIINLNNKKLENKKNLESFIRNFIPKCLPLSLIENYDNLLNISKKYPKNPKFIISSVEFDANDLFKIYSAEKIEQGTKIISGQHGNGSFLMPGSKYSPDFKFCDYHYTWGNKKDKSHIPFCNLNTINKTNIKNKYNKLVIYTTSHAFNHTLYDKQELNYQNVRLIQSLILTLPKKISTELLLKKHNAKHIDSHKYLEKEYEKLEIKKLTNHTFSQTLKYSKLNLYLYNSTGILDCLALNKPVIFFLKNPANLFAQNYNDKLEALKEANIFFKDIEELKEHIIRVWDDIDSWWKNDAVQNIIRIFNKDFNDSFNKKKFSNFCFTLNSLKDESIDKVDKIYPLW